MIQKATIKTTEKRILIVGKAGDVVEAWEELARQVQS